LKLLLPGNSSGFLPCTVMFPWLLFPEHPSSRCSRGKGQRRRGWPQQGTGASCPSVPRLCPSFTL